MRFPLIPILATTTELIAIAPFVAAQDSLDGYSFGCGGISRQFLPAVPIYLFDGADKIKCPDASGSGTSDCGTYAFNAAAQTLTGTISGVQFSTTNHFAKDGILISFLSVGYLTPCNVLTLNWRKFYTGNAGLFLKCPAQNPVPADASISYEEEVVVIRLFSSKSRPRIQSAATRLVSTSGIAQRGG